MHKYTLRIFLYMPEKPLIAKLFSSDFQKNIVQCRKLGEYSSKSDILTLQIIQKSDQVMLGAGTAEYENLIFIVQIKYMRKTADILQMFFLQKNCFYGDSFAGLDHFLQFFGCTGSNDPTMVHNRDASADLFNFFHIM